MHEKNDFEQLRKEMDAFDQSRERIIKRSRDITKQSKHAIYALLRDDRTEAAQHLVLAHTAITELLPAIQHDATLRTGGFSSGMEEYVEAKALLHFLEHTTLIARKDIPESSAEEYLGGLCDLAGELGRYAVLRATQRDVATVRAVRDVLNSLFGELAQFDFRNGELRRKYDGVKYAVQKVEQLLYELSLRI